MSSVLSQTRDGGRARVLAIEPASVLVPVGLFVAIVAVAAPNGSYFPSSWGWASLAFLWIAALALVLQRRVLLSPLETVYLGAWGVLLAWTAASLLWSPTITHTMYEVERTVVYVAFALALALVGRRGVPLLMPALLAGIVAVSAYGLATRLLPDRVGRFDSFVGYRLSEPLGYWNAVGIFAAIGIAVAVGLAARAEAIAVRALSAASLVLLFPVLYFTFGRGPWIALAVGLAIAIAIDPRRLQLVTTLLVVAPWPALALWRAYESPSLTTQFSALADASDEGGRLAVTIGVLAMVAVIVTTGFAVLSNRVTIARGVRRAYGAVLVVALVGCIAAVVTAYGGPADSYRRALDSIRQPSPNVRGDQTKRLFSLSSNGRLEQWDAALDQYAAHPASGAGAGTFERWWLEHRQITLKVRDAHSLYFETLAELGPFGLAGLLVIVLTPVAAAVRMRRNAVVAPALAGFATLAAHAGVDWDWEIPGVMIAGLTCAGALLLLGDRESRRWTIGVRTRAACLAGIAVLSVLSFVTLTSNRSLGQASAALNRADSAEAARVARRAETWAPWSTDAMERQADAALADGSLEDARRLYRAALAKDDGDWELWIGLALSSEVDAARQALRRARALNPLATEVRQLSEQLGVRNRSPDG